MKSIENDLQFDMNNMAVSDIRQVNNPVLRDLLLKVKQQMAEEGTNPGRAGHCSTSHSDHYTS